MFRWAIEGKLAGGLDRETEQAFEPGIEIHRSEWDPIRDLPTGRLPASAVRDTANGSGDLTDFTSSIFQFATISIQHFPTPSSGSCGRPISGWKSPC
jgi:hypothetical protein